MNDLYDKLNMICCEGVYCYVVKSDDGDILIDTGEARYRDSIEMWLLNYNVKKILLTHGHTEVVGNAKYFADTFGAKIYMSRDDYELACGRSNRNVYSVGLTGSALNLFAKKERQMPAEPFDVYKFTDDDPDLTEELGTDCLVYSMEGHTKGSVAYLFGEDLYIGDAVMNVVFPCFPALCESPKRARGSIMKIDDIAPERILFTHGKPIKTHDNLFYINLFSKQIIM